jgi:hypothetical protein
MTIDHNVPDPYPSGGQNAPETSQVRTGVEAYKRMRNAEPPNMPNQQTLAWIKSLSPDVQPFALLRSHARLANVIAELWEYPRSCRACMEQLLTDEHGNQRRFSPEVRGELVSLQRYFNNKDKNSP